MEKHFILATAGHVDHGKSALVKVLTGTEPDRLPEEKARGITIELGFAQLVLDGSNGQRFHIGVVDVPGHEDFVRSMIAGVGSVDLALFAIAADDGWMPQTEEHLQIMTYLGVTRAVVAVTKSDLAKTNRVLDQVRERLRGTVFADAPIVSTSTQTNLGIDDLKRSIVSRLLTTEARADLGKPRLFVDRVFAPRGVGTVVTGTLRGGKLSRDQGVIVQPQRLSARIRSIQNHGRHRDVAEPAMRTAINLPDIAIGARDAGIKRGDVVTIPGLGEPSATLDVVLERLSDPAFSQSAAAPRLLKSGATVYFHHGTARTAAKISLLEGQVLGCGERGIAQLRLRSPMLVLLGDRFVLRDPSERFTIGGGIVLNPDGDPANLRQPTYRALLAARAGPLGTNWLDVCLQSELAARAFADRTDLLRKSNFSDDEIAAALGRLHERGAIVLRGNIAADPPKWRALFDRATALIDGTHKTRPAQRGLDLAELRAQLGDQSPAVIEALVNDLCANGFLREKSKIARATHRAQLAPEDQPVAEEIRSALAAKPLDPPARKEIAKDRHRQQALRFLIEQGEVVEIGGDVIISRENFARMKKAVVAFLSKQNSATVSELRQELQTSRRIIIPFLEQLDRDGVTRRVGDKRVIGPI